MSGPRILVDADACPVKDEIYKVAFRRAVPVTIVSNARLRVPDHPLVERVVVSDGFDAADDWIAARTDAQALVVTADILLADRCLKAGGSVLAPTGKPFTTSSIGAAIATRAIMADLRAGVAGAAACSAARRRSPRRTARASCRRWIPRWPRSSGAERLRQRRRSITAGR